MDDCRRQAYSIHEPTFFFSHFTVLTMEITLAFRDTMSISSEHEGSHATNPKQKILRKEERCHRNRLTPIKLLLLQLETSLQVNKQHSGPFLPVASINSERGVYPGECTISNHSRVLQIIRDSSAEPMDNQRTILYRMEHHIALLGWTTFRGKRKGTPCERQQCQHLSHPHDASESALLGILSVRHHVDTWWSLPRHPLLPRTAVHTPLDIPCVSPQDCANTRRDMAAAGNLRQQRIARLWSKLQKVHVSAGAGRG